MVLPKHLEIASGAGHVAGYLSLMPHVMLFLYQLFHSVPLHLTVHLFPLILGGGGGGLSLHHLHLHLGFVHPLHDVGLHQCLTSSSVCCFPNPGGSLLLCYVILPSSAWSSSRPLPSPWLPLCESLCPPIVL